MLETDVMAEGNEIDLVKYGVLWQKVQDMDKKVDKMDSKLWWLLCILVTTVVIPVVVNFLK